MQLDWRIKSAAFRAVTATHAYPVLYFAQRNISRRGVKDFSGVLPVWTFHDEAIAMLDVERPRVFEFGAGQTCAQNLYLAYRHGGRLEQTVVDLLMMFKPELADAASLQIAAALGVEPVRIRGSADLERLGIRYVAPFDATTRSLGEGTIDLCLSTNTLEHIPPADIARILSNVHSMTAPGGLLSAKIDYTDHYAHTDRNIGTMNYLRFTEAQWRRHNSLAHYQNRLRHQEHRRLLRGAGFEPVTEHVISTAEAVDHVERADLADDPETFIEHAHFIARRTNGAGPAVVA